MPVSIRLGLFAAFFFLLAPQLLHADVPTPRETAERFYGEVVNERNFDLLPEILGPHFKNHSDIPGGRENGAEGLGERLETLQKAFPDYRLTVQDMLVDGETVTTRVTLQGTHKGPLPGIRPTEKRVYTTGIEILRIREGRVAERWANYDLLWVLEQMGIEPLLQAPATRVGPDA